MVQRRLYNFRIDPDLDAGLKLVKERDGIAESEQIRRAVREWLERRKAIKAERKRADTRKRS
jgi:Arc/MetJ-type ribon-helix-helix transcriptional regulator